MKSENELIITGASLSKRRNVMFRLATNIAYKALHEGHQLLLLILVEAKSMKGLWFMLFLGALIFIIALQVLWPSVTEEAKMLETDVGI